MIVYLEDFFVSTSDKKVTPEITTSIPKICKKLNASPKKTNAKSIVETGPKLPNMEKFEAPSRLMDSETKKEGINVEIMAIRRP